MNTQRRLLFSAAAIVCAVFAAPTLPAGTLVAHYEFENPDDLGLDSSGMGNHATTVDNVTQVEGQFGQGALFEEGQGSLFVKPGGLTGFTGETGQTFAAWVKLVPGTTGFDGIISQDTGGCCLNRILLHPDHKPFINLSQHSDRHLSGSSAVVIDEWAHIAMTAENVGGGSQAHVYLNGVEVSGSPQAFPLAQDASTWNTYLGAGEGGTSHRLTGVLDDVRIYEGTLTAEEILELLNPATVGFQITEIIYDKVNDTFRFTWTSRDSKTYGLFYSTDLTDFGSDVDDGIESQGETTTFPPAGDPALPNPLPGADRIYFRVAETL